MARTMSASLSKNIKLKTRLEHPKPAFSYSSRPALSIYERIEIFGVAQIGQMVKIEFKIG